MRSMFVVFQFPVNDLFRRADLSRLNAVTEFVFGGPDPLADCVRSIKFGS